MTLDQELAQHVDEVEKNLARSEFDFSSNVPVVGPLIRAVRVLWNNIAARWYVQHYVDQQMTYDRSVYYALRIMQHRYEVLAAQHRALLVQLEDLSQLTHQWAEDAAQRDQDGLQRDKELSARLYNQSQQVEFLRSLFEKDFRAVVDTFQRFERELGE